MIWVLIYFIWMPSFIGALIGAINNGKQANLIWTFFIICPIINTIVALYFYGYTIKYLKYKSTWIKLGKFIKEQFTI